MAYQTGIAPAVRRVLLALVASGLAGALQAQQVADPGFRSVGRGAALAATLPTIPFSRDPKMQPLDRIIESFQRLQPMPFVGPMKMRSEEHTSELQSH